MSYTHLLYHIIFRPRNSVPVIRIEHESVLYRYIWGFIKKQGGILYRIGGMPDHIHMLVQLPASIALSNFMHDLKLATHKFLREHPYEFPDFESWGKSYCALTCSESVKATVINYIKNQKAHHSQRDFRDELLTLLREHKVDVDMKYFLKE